MVVTIILISLLIICGFVMYILFKENSQKQEYIDQLHNELSDIDVKIKENMDWFDRTNKIFKANGAEAKQNVSKESDSVSDICDDIVRM